MLGWWNVPTDEWNVSGSRVQSLCKHVMFYKPPGPAVAASPAASSKLSQFSAEPGPGCCLSHGKPGLEIFPQFARERRKITVQCGHPDTETADVTTLDILSGVRDFLSPVNMPTVNKIRRRWGGWRYLRRFGYSGNTVQRKSYCVKHLKPVKLIHLFLNQLLNFSLIWKVEGPLGYQNKINKKSVSVIEAEKS